jgi:hypothetical protein
MVDPNSSKEVTLIVARFRLVDVAPWALLALLFGLGIGLLAWSLMLASAVWGLAVWLGTFFFWQKIERRRRSGLLSAPSSDTAKDGGSGLVPGTWARWESIAAFALLMATAALAAALSVGLEAVCITAIGLLALMVADL